MGKDNGKTRQFGAMIMACVVTVSCASPPKPTAATPVGPPPYETSKSGRSGQLQVYTARESFDWSDAYRDEYLAGNFVDRPQEKAHSDYRIYTPKGKLVQRVRNAKNPEDAKPALVSLPAGDYWVKAEAEGYGVVTLPVVIQPGERTPLHLEKGWQPRTPPAQPDAIVQLAPHYPIGWRSAQRGGR
jgi:hypothetical protein